MPPAAAGDGPLDLHHMEELVQANARAGKVLRAARVATFSGWSVAVFAALSLLLSLTSFKGLLVSAAMAVVAWNELRGSRMLRRFELRGPRLLGWNQVGFAAVLITYSAWSIWSALAAPNPYLAQMEMSPDASSTLGSIGELYTNITVAVYGGLIVISFFCQGLTALYYFTRARHIGAYLARTPDWVVAIQRASMGA